MYLNNYRFDAFSSSCRGVRPHFWSKRWEIDTKITYFDPSIRILVVRGVLKVFFFRLGIEISFSVLTGWTPSVKISIEGSNFFDNCSSEDAVILFFDSKSWLCESHKRANFFELPLFPNSSFSVTTGSIFSTKVSNGDVKFVEED